LAQLVANPSDRVARLLELARVETVVLEARSREHCIRDLTLAEIKTLDCGFTDPDFLLQVRVPTPMPTLQELFDYVKAHATYPVRFNETKISPLVADTVPYDAFTQKLVDAIRSNGLEDRAMIQSFDWRTIILAKKLDPKIETVALVWQFAGSDCDKLDDECSLEAVMGDASVKRARGYEHRTYGDWSPGPRRRPRRPRSRSSIRRCLRARASGDRLGLHRFRVRRWMRHRSRHRKRVGCVPFDSPRNLPPRGHADATRRERRSAASAIYI
jgi:glycerophosphoryl diester phosphodiesterase